MCIKIHKVKKKSVLVEDHEDSATILSDLKLLLNILKAVGLFPIFTQTSAKEIEPPTKQNEFYSFFIRSIIHLLTIFNLYTIFNQRSVHVFNTNRETDNINHYIEIIISITTYTGTVILCSVHSRTFLKIINEILKVDFEIRQRHAANVRNHCEFTKKSIGAVIILQLFIIGVKFSTSSFTTMSQHLTVGFYAFQNCICSVFLILLSSLLRMISMRFEFVNMILGAYAYDKGGIRRRRLNNVYFEEDASFAFAIHNKLLKIYRMLNESCSLLVAFFMGYAFYTITTNTYYIFVELTTKRSLGILLNCFAWLGLNTTLVNILTQSCGRATKQANTTSQILARVYGKSKDYQNIIDKFLTKSIRQDVQFTAYGFFVVDNSTLFKIFSAVTTYLVILIQFKQLEDTKLDENVDV